MTSPAHKTIPIGSAAYLASGGHVTQTLNYLPYGEDWVDIKHNLDPSLGQYTFTGERRLKLTGESNRLDVNADFMTTGTLLNTPTLYPSAYLVLTSKGYTKHYYVGADRVAASLGGGGLKAVGSNPGMQDRADWLFWESHERVNGRMLQENDHKCIWQSSLPTGEYCKPIDGIPGRMKASVEFYLNDLYDNLKMLAEEQHDEKDVYFYHSDHLGSASWITDADGKPIQHLQYLPYGEPYVNQRISGYNERFTFTGKERDEETGYGYFGARYMDHELMTMWISVDPMADKYPSISPYAYCAWNPVKLVDPDGREIKFDPESEAIIAEFKQRTETEKANAQITKQSDELQQALDELEILRGSDQMYHIEYGNTGDLNRKGVTDYDIENNRVRIVIAFDGKVGDIAHELKHAFQFEKGEISFDAQTGLGMESHLYDITDEQAAYKRGEAFGNTIPKNIEWHEKSPLGGGAFYYPFLNFGDVQYPNIPGNKSRRIDAEMIHGLPASSNTIYRYEGKTYNNKK